MLQSGSKPVEHSTERLRTPSPHETLQDPNEPVIHSDGVEGLGVGSAVVVEVEGLGVGGRVWQSCPIGRNHVEEELGASCFSL